MSENKCQLHVGDIVWLVPFDELAAEYNHAVKSICGISRERWEAVRKHGPHQITETHNAVTAVRLEDTTLWWPHRALSFTQQALSPAIEDLL